MSSNSTNPPPSTSEGPKVNDELLVYHISLLIISFVAVLFVCRLPRAIIRFFRWSEISKGHLLSYATAHRRPRIAHVTHEPPSVSSPTETISDESHRSYSYVQRVDEKGAAMIMDYPPHLASCPSIFRGVASELIYRIAPGYSVAQVICALIYMAAWVYPMFYKSNPLSDYARAGWIGVAQLPFIFAFASKNNALGPFLGIGYEKVRLFGLRCRT